MPWPERPVAGRHVPRRQLGRWGVGILVVFAVLFVWARMGNIQIENGYRVSALELRLKRLEEERSRLEAERSQLLNLERVESIVTARLRYGYPRPDQFIKVFMP